MTKVFLKIEKGFQKSEEKCSYLNPKKFFKIRKQQNLPIKARQIHHTQKKKGRKLYKSDVPCLFDTELNWFTELVACTYISFCIRVPFFFKIFSASSREHRDISKQWLCTRYSSLPLPSLINI